MRQCAAVPHVPGFECAVVRAGVQKPWLKAGSTASWSVSVKPGIDTAAMHARKDVAGQAGRQAVST